MSDPILQHRYSPNGPDASGSYGNPGSAPNVTPSPVPPTVVSKPGFQPGHIDAETAAAAQAVNTAPSTPQGDSDD
jgi:hypothetical protein